AYGNTAHDRRIRETVLDQPWRRCAVLELRRAAQLQPAVRRFLVVDDEADARGRGGCGAPSHPQPRLRCGSCRRAIRARLETAVPSRPDDRSRASRPAVDRAGHRVPGWTGRGARSQTITPRVDAWVAVRSRADSKGGGLRVGPGWIAAHVH